MPGNPFPNHFIGSGTFGHHSGLMINGSLFSGNGTGVGPFGGSFMGTGQAPGH